MWETVGASRRAACQAGATSEPRIGASHPPSRTDPGAYVLHAHIPEDDLPTSEWDTWPVPLGPSRDTGDVVRGGDPLDMAPPVRMRGA